MSVQYILLGHLATVGRSAVKLFPTITVHKGNPTHRQWPGGGGWLFTPGRPIVLRPGGRREVRGSDVK